MELFIIVMIVIVGGGVIGSFVSVYKIFKELNKREENLNKLILDSAK